MIPFVFNQSGDTIDLDSFCGNIISECEKTEESLMNTWFKKLTRVFGRASTMSPIVRGERKMKRFYQCASSLISIQVSSKLCSLSSSLICAALQCFQLRDLLMRSVSDYVLTFADRRKLPRIEMELVLQGSKIAFSPSIQEVTDMILSVITEAS